MPYLFEKNLGASDTSGFPLPSGVMHMHVGYVALSSGTGTYTIPELVAYNGIPGVTLAYLGSGLSNTGQLAASLSSGVLTVSSSNASDANNVLFCIFY